MKSYIGFFILAFFLVFVSCKRDHEDPQPGTTESMDELTIPQDFNWETYHDVKLVIAAQQSQTSSVAAKISVYKDDPAMGGKIISSGSASSQIDFQTEIRIPAYTKELYLQCEFPFGGSQIVKVSTEDNMINHTFSNTKSAAAEGQYKSSNDVGPDCDDCDYTVSGTSPISIGEDKVYCVTDNFSGSVTFEGWNDGGTLKVCGTAEITNNLSLGKHSKIIVTQTGNLTINGISMNGFDNGIIVYENATITFNNGLTTQCDYLENQGTMTVNGNLTIQSIVQGFKNSGTINVTSGNVQTNNTISVTNSGTINVTGSHFYINNGATMHNYGAINFTKTSSGQNHFQINSGSSLTNDGTIDVTGSLYINSNSSLINNCSLMCTETLAVNSSDFKNYSGYLRGAQLVHLTSSSITELNDGSMISSENITINGSAGVIGKGTLNSIKASGTFTISGTNTVSGAVETATDDFQSLQNHDPSVHFVSGATLVGLDEITNHITISDCNPEGIGSPTIIDTDGDGVPDPQDDYPNDYYRAYNNFFPEENSYSTVLFEDLWPSKGDYDFNDLVLGLYGTEVTNASNNVVEVFINFNVRAVGASFKNGFGWQFANIPPSAIQQVSGASLNPSGGSTITNNANGTEQGQDSAVIIAIENIEDVINRVGGSMYNTVENGLVGISDLVEIHVYFGESTPLDRDLLSPKSYNIFLIKNQDRGVEVHLSDRQPTNLMTYPLGTVDDSSDPLTGRYFKTQSNLPWGLILYEPFDYPIEKIPIIEAYPDFAEWAQSGGVLKPDWYLNPDLQKIWTP